MTRRALAPVVEVTWADCPGTGKRHAQCGSDGATVLCPDARTLRYRPPSSDPLAGKLITTAILRATARDGHPREVITPEEIAQTRKTRHQANRPEEVTP